MSKSIRTSLLTLSAGNLVVEIAPQIGGSVASFRTYRASSIFNLMRPMPEEASVSRNAASAAMFPMVPYANCIAGNRFDFDGRTYQFKQNVAGEPFTIHGTGWQSEWSVGAATTTVSAELTLDHLTSGEAYSYSAFQRFLSLARSPGGNHGRVANRGDRVMPFGFG